MNEHTGQHRAGCNECNVARATITRGYCHCRVPIPESMPMWDTAQCGRCGREMQP